MLYGIDINFFRLIQFIYGIEGWLTIKEAELLYELARNCTGNGVIVEIGSYKGRSTVCLALGSKSGKNVPIYSVDHHTGSPEHRGWFGQINTLFDFKKNIEKVGVNDLIIPLVMQSEKAAVDFEKQIELLFIDGAHEYESVKQDFEVWTPKLINGGIIVMHDINLWPGPTIVVDKFLINSNKFEIKGIVDSALYAIKMR